MRRPTTLRGTITAGLLGLAAVATAASSARASDYCPPDCTYVWVTRYVEREVEYTKTVVRYDHCGRPYEVVKTYTATVSVPVRKRVLVCAY